MRYHVWAMTYYVSGLSLRVEPPCRKARLYEVQSSSGTHTFSVALNNSVYMFLGGLPNIAMLVPNGDTFLASLPRWPRRVLTDVA